LSRHRLLHELLLTPGGLDESAVAVVHGEHDYSRAYVADEAARIAGGLIHWGLRSNDRLAIYLPKQIETVVSMFASSFAGAAFVPVNPILKPTQVAHILNDSEAKFLITSTTRWAGLLAAQVPIPPLMGVIVVDSNPTGGIPSDVNAITWQELSTLGTSTFPRRLENDIAALLYTSGSTGNPKGVILSHRNIVVGALSVVDYLENTSNDRILSLLPLSFDAGMSQVTTAFAAGARVILLDYLLPRDVVRACEQHAVTGITGVPPLWMQLVDQSWPAAATRSIRYFANTGGKMPRETLQRLRSHFPKAKPYLMYGLTEAFRSTYLPPHEVDRIPDSIGKAIPNAEILVVRPDGTPCEPGEPGELVHRGPLVSLGYWKDLERTRERFRPAPGQPKELPHPEIAVWSGDTVTKDADGYLYFVGRSDHMIKSSGYRISPTELEEIAFASGLVLEVAALGVPDPRLGHRIVIVARSTNASEPTTDLLSFYRTQAPAYMVPSQIEWRTALPRNPNGKIDRRQLSIEFLGERGIGSR
jgi:acyl-CoA ligase (AMP-forming) (exosortase A-associated)